MKAPDPAVQSPERPPPTPVTPDNPLPPDRADPVRPLTWLTILTIAAPACLFASRFSGNPAGPGSGITIASLLIAALGLLMCLAMTHARSRPHSTAARWMVGWPQTMLTLLVTATAAAAVLADWPSRQIPIDAGGFTAASVLLLLATPWLLAERIIAAIPAQRLPEAADLGTLLFLPVFFLGAQAVLLILESFGFGALDPIHAALSALLLLICVELTARVLATWFLPPTDSTAAKATIGSLAASIPRGRLLSPGGIANAVRSQFGMDFSRSWALHFGRAAATPVALSMLVFCWCLTGVTRIDLNERGSYERFGRAATTLRPGLHLVLPWPFGVVRHLEFGVIHTALISDPTAPLADDNATAEGDAPDTANRLWDKEQPSDLSYIIASGEPDRQSLQTVSASVRVLYRIGLRDTDARASLYRTTDPDALIHALTGRLLARFFAARTLPDVLGGNQGVIARDLRDRLRQALDRLATGIDVVAVTIEAIHPPAGAASAYRSVQAAQIDAGASIATEQGRAQTTRRIAERDAHTATGDATAAAAETISAARVDLIDITADDRPYRAAGQPFLLERYFTDVRTALTDVPLEIVDHHLTGASLPTIDLRPPGTARDVSAAHGTSPEKTP